MNRPRVAQFVLILALVLCDTAFGNPLPPQDANQPQQTDKAQPARPPKGSPDFNEVIRDFMAIGDRP